MRKLGLAFVILSGLAFLIAGLALIAKQSFGARAVLVQRVQVDKAGEDLFGDSANTPIGSPQRLIIQDKEAFLPGEGPDGAKLVSQNYLDEKGIYPLQMQTVDFMTTVATVAGAVVGVILLVIGRFLGRKASRLP